MKTVDSTADSDSADRHSSSDSLDTTPDPRFDELAKLAAQICHTSHAFILLADKNKQRCKSKFGPQLNHESFDAALCTLEVRSAGSMLSAGMLQDNLLNQNPYVVNAPHFRFFAGIPVLGNAGEIVGTLGVLDESPREIAPENLEALRIVSRQVLAQLDVKRQARIAMRAEQELERRTLESMEREKLLTLVIDLVPHHIFAKDRDGRFLFVNRRSATACGLTPEEMIGRSEHELRLDSDNAENFLREDCEVIDGGIPKIIPEERITYADKQVHILHTTKIPFLPPGSKQRAVLGVGIDITERKRAGEELQRFTLMMEHILENVPAFIFWKDTDLCFMGCNKLFAEAAGAASPADIIGKSDYDMVWKSNAAAFQATDREIIETGKPKLNYEEAQTLTDGTTRWVRTSKTPLFTINGEVFGVLGVYMDITQRKTAEDEIRVLNSNLERRVEDRTAKLNALNASLTSEIAVRKRAEIDLVNALHAADDANNAKSSFLARMSHEIRTPMNGVIGMNYLLQQTELSPKQRQYTTKIDFAAQHLLGIINGILDFSKIEAGKTELEIAEFNLEETVRRVLDFTAIQGQSKSLESKVYFASNTPVKVFGDSLRLGQILTNLVGNAIKFTERGRVEITVLPTELTASHVILEFRIADTGIGMTPEQLAKIFMPFAQSDTTTTRRFGGTGLGLAIAKSLIQLMGGNISVQSEAGRGSTFRFNVRLGIGQGLKPVHGSGEILIDKRSSARMLRVESI